MRVAIVTPEVPRVNSLAVSADGEHVAFAAPDASGIDHLSGPADRFRCLTEAARHRRCEIPLSFARRRSDRVLRGRQVENNRALHA